MNIFYLHKDPKIAAQMQINKHVVKMILESAQLLSTAHRVIDGFEEIKLSINGRRLKTWTHPNPTLNSLLYQSTHVNHPCAIWVRQSNENYMWLYEHFKALCEEYTRRYKKIHATDLKLSLTLQHLPEDIPYKDFTEPPLAMLDIYKASDAVQSYRNYYEGEKLDKGNTEEKERYFSFIVNDGN